MSNTGLYCTNCKKEFGLDDTVILKVTGFVSLTGLGCAVVLPSDGPYIEQLCEDCGKLLQVKEKPAPDLVKAIQMEREIVGHLLADDPNLWIMTEWKEAMDYTNGLTNDPQPKASALQLAEDRFTALRVAAILAIEDIDTGFPLQAKCRLRNLLSSTKMIIQPNRVVVEVTGQQVLFISAERPKELVVIIHDKEKGHSWDRTHTVRKLMIAEREEEAGEARPLQHPKLLA